MLWHHATTRRFLLVGSLEDFDACLPDIQDFLCGRVQKIDSSSEGFDGVLMHLHALDKRGD